MHEEIDETTLTAYALGELDDEACAAVEAVLATAAEARREVAEVRETAGQLREAFASPTRHELSAAQRASIETAAGQPVARTPRARRPLDWWLVAKVAAVTLIAVGVSVETAPRLLPKRASGVEYFLEPPRLQQPAGTPSRQPVATHGNVVATRMETEQLERLRALGYMHPGTGDVASFSPRGFEADSHDYIRDNSFVLTAQDPRSTFSVDVDTASYAIVRRHLNEGRLPPKDAVRVEELINYFPYDYAPPAGEEPFAVHLETAACPWKPEHRLVRLGIKGREMTRHERPAANFVFLLDVSGSMNAPDRLPLVKQSMRLLVEQLEPRDRVAIVVYAGGEGLALPSTPATNKAAILEAIESLSAGGSTHGSAGIRLAYETAGASFVKGGINRVILATDGDFNVGVTSRGDLIRLIEAHARSGVFLTTLGFGMGNLKDSTLEKLAQHGNGNYAYVDSLFEARKVLVEQAGGTLVALAKDVKLQVEFNPAKVKAFRLVGYENRVLAHQDFNDDTRDAGDIGAGHTITALYEVVPAQVGLEVPGVDPLKYQRAPEPGPAAASGELLTLKLRYKQPDGQRSALIEVPLQDGGQDFEDASLDFRFAASVAAFGMSLRDSPYKGAADLEKVLAWGSASVGEDPGRLRAEFLGLVQKSRSLSPR